MENIELATLNDKMTVILKLMINLADAMQLEIKNFIEKIKENKRRNGDRDEIRTASEALQRNLEVYEKTINLLMIQFNEKILFLRRISRTPIRD
ncbi:hypothetical protein PanWU01x14_287280 [Parasponia andersonii]|uniref:Uncharacterized protein n=1 Tax=Parasponia andersonii TaxID=3476 RepID=A0A2P5AYY0_PARAD|nr:hypothetical protein PanWU01x14_287280 [Parasponia andersonii]